MPGMSTGGLLLPGGRPQPAKKVADPNAPIPVVTAFLVIVQPDGRIVFDNDINKPYVPERPPHRDDVRGALLGLAAKMAAEDSGAATVQRLQAQAEAAMAAQQEMAYRAALEQAGSGQKR